MEKTVEVPEEAKDIPELRFQKQISEKHSFHYESPKFPQKEIAQDLRKMNNIQQDLSYYIKNCCLKLLWNKKPEPFSISLTGGTETGKSHIIRCIYHEATRILSKVSNTPTNLILYQFYLPHRLEQLHSTFKG